MSNLEDQINQAEEEHGKSGGLYELQEGSNVMRIMTHLTVYPQHYSQSGYKGICLGKEEGCPGCIEDSKVNIRWLGWILPKKVNENNEYEVAGSLQTAYLPHTVAKKLSQLQNDPDYKFDTFPMPYDVKVIKKKTGAKNIDVEYDVLPGKESAVDVKWIEELKPQTPAEEIKQKAKEKKAREHDIVLEGMDPGPAEGAATAADYPEEDISPEDIPF